MHRYVILLAIAASTILISCASSYEGNGGGFPFQPTERLDVTRFSRFSVGSTTKYQVIETLGKPGLWETHKDGSSYLMYGYVGDSFAGMTKVEYVKFEFNANKVLSAMEVPGSRNK